MSPSADPCDTDIEGENGRTHRRPPRRARWLPPNRPLGAALVGLALCAAGCGGSKPPGAAGGSSASRVLGQFEAYASCMRSHGISDFPDPTASPGGGVSFQINDGPGSDL